MPQTYQFGPGEFTIDGTLQLRSGDTLCGAGRGQTRLKLAYPYQADSVVRVGGFAEQDWPAGGGFVLDGWRTLYQFAGPLSQRPLGNADPLRQWGDGWAGVDEFCVALGFQPAASDAGGYEVLGWNAGPDFTPSPILLSAWPGEGHQYRLSVNATYGVQAFAIDVPPAAWYARHEVVWQVDLMAGVWTGWLDGFRVAFGVFDGGQRLTQNVFAAFAVGGHGGTYGQAGHARGTFYGVRFDTKKRFNYAAALPVSGDDLLRCTLNDLDAAEVAPEAVSRQFGNYARPVITNGRELAEQVTIRDITIQGGHFGAAVESANAQDFALRDARCFDSAYGLAASGGGSQYPVTLDRVWLDGTDAAVYLHLTRFSANHLRIGPGGRWAWVQRHGDTFVSRLDGDDPRLSSGDGCWLRYDIAHGQPNRFTLLSAGWDYEGGSGGRSRCLAIVTGPEHTPENPIAANIQLMAVDFPPAMFERDEPEEPACLIASAGPAVSLLQIGAAPPAGVPLVSPAASAV